MTQRFAVLSVSDKRGIAPFGKRLVELGFTLLSTGGTKAALAEAGVPVTSVSTHTGAPEILDGRVKTLHPVIHGGILAKDNADHRAALQQIDAAYIDLVCVNLYPFAETIAKDGVTMDEALENIDIGGPTMIRAAAKNWPRVAVVCDPDDYDRIADELADGLSDGFRQSLAAKAFAHTAAYDAMITDYLNDGALTLNLKQSMSLRYGENPHQAAALYAYDNGGLANATPLQGKALSYNNFLDLDAALACCREFDDACAVVIKHTNPCGVATAETLAQAYTDARATDPTSAFGSIVALNREVDGATAALLAETFLECVIAPSYSSAARETLAKKKNLRLIEIPWDDVKTHRQVRSIDGGLLVQDQDAPARTSEATVATKRAPSEEESKALDFAWRVGKHIKSNAIVFCKGTRTVGVGAGQMSRVDSAQIAVSKANEDLKGAVVASDAFFPFRDGLDALAAAGATAVVQPGGSKRDQEVIDAADEHGMAMIFTGRRHFRH